MKSEEAHSSALDERIAWAIRQLRGFEGWTQGELAKHASSESRRVTQSAVSKLESGQSMNVTALEPVARALGLPLSKLFAFAESIDDPRRVKRSAKAFVERYLA